jgi:hypothetical protein
MRAAIRTDCGTIPAPPKLDMALHATSRAIDVNENAGNECWFGWKRSR